MSMFRAILRALRTPVAALVAVGALHYLRLEAEARLHFRVSDEMNLWFDHALGILYWLTAALLVLRLVNLLFWDGVITRMLGRPAPKLLKDFTGVILLVVAISGIISTVYHESMMGVWATSSVVGIVLGFALRSLILDIFMGLSVNLDRSFQIGDWVEIFSRELGKSQFGKVVEIHWRTTRVELENKNTLVLPNSLIAAVGITNFSQPTPIGRDECPVTLDISVPADRAIRILDGALKALDHPAFVEHPPSLVLVQRTDQEGVTYLMRYWFDINRISPTTARSHVKLVAMRHLTAAGIHLARPRSEVFLGRARDLDRGAKPELDRARLVSGVRLFTAACTAEERAQLAAAMARREIPAGQDIVAQGAEGRSMFLIAEGTAEVLVRFQPGAAPGRVARLGPGEVFGEMSLLTGEPRTATVRALSALLVYEIDKDVLAGLLEARPEMVEPLTGFMVERQEATLAARDRADAGRAGSDAARQGFMKRMRGFFGLKSAARAAEAR